MSYDESLFGRYLAFELKCKRASLAPSEQIEWEKIKRSLGKTLGSSGTKAEEARESVRVAARLQVRCKDTTDGDETITRAVIVNISRKGAFLLVEKPLPVGSQVSCSIQPHGGGSRAIEASGEVLWTSLGNNDDKSSHPGMGIRLILTNAKDQCEFDDLYERTLHRAYSRALGHVPQPS